MKIVREYLESQFFKKIHLPYLFSKYIQQRLCVYNEHEYLIEKRQFKYRTFIWLHNIHAEINTE
jgi:hypothetical protein